MLNHDLQRNKLSHLWLAHDACAVPLLRSEGMTMASMTIKVRIAWWVRWYISSVALCAFLTGFQPDMDKVKAKVMKGVILNTGA